MQQIVNALEGNLKEQYQRKFRAYGGARLRGHRLKVKVGRLWISEDDVLTTGSELRFKISIETTTRSTQGLEYHTMCKLSLDRNFVPGDLDAEPQKTSKI